MKKLVCLLLITSVALAILSLAVYAADIEHKIDPLQIEYLQKLGEQNITWAKILMTINTLTLFIIAVSFGSILWIIIRQVREVSQKIKIARKYAKQVESHEREIANIKNTIRDAELNRRQILEKDIVRLLKEDFKWPTNVFHVNIVKDFIWSEGIEDVNELKGLIDDRARVDSIEKRYRAEIGEFINKGTLLNWCYLIKKKSRKLDDLIYDAKEREELYRAIAEQRIKLRHKE